MYVDKKSRKSKNDMKNRTDRKKMNKMDNGLFAFGQKFHFQMKSQQSSKKSPIILF